MNGVAYRARSFGPPPVWRAYRSTAQRYDTPAAAPNGHRGGTGVAESMPPLHQLNEALRNTIAMVLAGGQGERLSPLTRDRAKPAVPFGGVYRVIDFTLSNCINSG